MPVKLHTNTTTSDQVFDFECLRRQFRGRAVPQSSLISFPKSASDNDGEWEEVEGMGPSAHDLIRLVQQFPAPDGWE